MMSTNVLSYRNDLLPDGVNSTETALTPANVKLGSFGKLYATATDGTIYAQPLVVSGETINSGVNTTAGAAGVYNVVYVVTENDSVYAINTVTGGVLWKRSFLNTTGVGAAAGYDINNPLSASAITAPTSTQIASTDISPIYGITGTPVIDLPNNRMFLVALTAETVNGVTDFVQRLHAINLSDGTDQVTPYTIGITSGTNTNTTSIYTYGSGDGSVTDPYNNTGNPVVQFNALRDNQRSALSLVNGTLYVSWAGHSDDFPYHGWVVSWNVSSLTTAGFQLSGVLCTSPDGGGAGIWGGGGGLSFDPDEANTFYFETGNGFGATSGITLNAQGFPTGGSLYEAVVKVVTDSTSSPTNQNVNGWGFKVTDYFVPYNQAALDNADQDLGSGSALVLPDSAGIPGAPHLLVAAGKQGVIYLINRDNMGHYDPANDHVLNAVPNGNGNNTPPVNVVGVLSTPVYYNNTLYYVGGYSGPSVSFSISSSGTLIPKSQTAANSFGYLPGSPSLSSNGAQNGIIWQTDRNTNELHAYDANSYGTELWNSGQKANSADAVGSVVKFASPTVVNGEVFEGTTNSLVAYGLTPPSSTTPAAPVVTVTPLGETSVNLTWIDNTLAPNLATGYLIEESVDGVNFTQITTAPAGATALAIGGLTPNSKYYFRVRSQNTLGYSVYSTVVSVVTTTQVVSVLDGSFENESVSGSYKLDPASANWSFTGNAGVEANGSSLGAANAPSGTQAAFLESTTSAGGSISQTLAVAANGTFQFTFSAAELSGYAADPIAVAVDGSTVATIAPTSTGFASYSTPTLTLTAGSHVLSFSAVPISSGQSYSLLDNVNAVVISAVTAPNAPSALGGLPASAVSISLSWTANSANQTGYYLDRATDSGFTQNLVTQTIPATPASCVDSLVGLASGGTYYYRIRAFNSGGSSANSNTVSVYIPFSPAKASNCVFDSVTSTSISLHWTDNAASTAQGYHILRSVNGGTYSLYTTLPGLPAGIGGVIAPTEYDWTDTGLTPGTFYDYHIQCFNVAGYNDFVGGNATTLTNPPASVTATAKGSQVLLAWAAPVGAASYNIYRGTTPGGEGSTPIATGLTATSYTDTPPVSGVRYYYTVTAVNANAAPLNGESAPSSEVSSISVVASVSDGSFENTSVNGSYVYDPTSSYWKFTGNAGIEANGSAWNAASAPDGTQAGFLQSLSTSSGGSISQTINFASPGTFQFTFSAAQRASDGVEPISVAVDGTVIATITPGSTAFQTYSTPVVSLTGGSHVLSFTTASKAGSSASSFIDKVSVATLSTAPVAPTGVSAVAGVGQVGLSWTASVGAVSYNIYRGTNAGGEGSTALVTAIGGNSYIDTTAIPGSKYYYTVTAVSGTRLSGLSNESAFSSEVSATSLIAVVSDGSFESTSVKGSYAVDPTSAVWTFAGNAGIEANGSALSASNAPDGTQAAFLQSTSASAGGSISQTLNIGAEGFYSFTLYAAERAAYSVEPIVVSIDGAVIATINPASTSFVSYTTPSVNLLAGTHVLSFATASTSSTAAASFIDKVSVNVVSTASAAPSAVAATPGIGRITVSWNAVAGAVSYNVYRGLAAGAEGATPLASGVTSTSYVDTSASPGVQYYYVVSAVDGNPAPLNVQSAVSAEVSSQINIVKLTGTVIGTPISWLNKGDTIAQVFDGNFNTYFDAANNNTANWAGLDLGSPQNITQIQYAPRAGYEYRMVGGQFQVSSTADFSSNVVTLYTVTAIPVAGQFTAVAVNPGGAYRYVRFVGGAGWVNIAEMEVDGLYHLPAGPTAVTISTSPVGVTVGWAAVSGATSYEIYRGTSSGGEAAAPIATGITSLSYLDTQVVTGVSYYYYVTAVSAGVGGVSSQSLASAEVSVAAGVISTVPGIIQAANYDLGGQGVAYNSATTINQGGAYRNDGIGIEATEAGSGPYNVGWTLAGEWIDYTVSVQSTGYYTFALLISMPNTGGLIHISIDGTNVTGELAVPVTAGWQNFTTMTSGPALITAGTHVMRLTVDAPGNNTSAFNVATIAVEPASPSAPAGVQIADSPIGVTLSWTASANASSYNIYRGSSSGGEAATPIATGVTALSYLDTQVQTGIKYYYYVTAVSLATGATSYQSAASAEVSTIAGVVSTVPGVILAVNYDLGGQGVAYNSATTVNQGGAYRNDGIGIEASTSGGYDVGWTLAGEWLNYTISVAASGQYTFALQLASLNNGGALHLNIDGTNVTGTVAIPNTGSWQTFTTVTTSPVQISAGTHVLRLQFDAPLTNDNAGNVKTITISPANALSAPTSLAATAGVGQISLGWSASVGAVSYNIYRGTIAGGEGSVPLASGVTGTSYIDASVVVGTKYYYTVTAVNGNAAPYNVQSAASSEVSASVTVMKFTGTPIGTSTSYANNGDTIAQVFDGNLSTSFDAPNSSLSNWVGLDLGSAQTITELQYAPRPGGFAKRMVGGQFQVSSTADFSSNVVTIYTVSAIPADGQYTVVNVNPGGAYRYVRYTGGTNWVNIAEMAVGGVPATATVPAGVSATAGAGSISLSWTGSSNDVTYNIYRGTSAGGEGATPLVSGVTGTSYIDTTVAAGAVAGTTYYYVVTGVSASGAVSAFSAEVSATVTTVKLTGTAIGTQTSWLNNGDTIAQVFDGNFNTYFDAANSNLTNWVGLDLGSARSITQIQYAPRAGYEWRMVGGQFQVSSTPDFSSNVVTIYTITTAPVAGQFTVVPVNPGGAYRYVRYTGGTGWVNIAEMEVDGTPAAAPVYTKLSGTAIGTQTSWLNNGDTIAQVFDGNFSSYFDAPNSNLTNWVGLDLGGAQQINVIKYAPRAGYEWRMVGGQFQVSSTPDFSSNVVTIYTITTAPVAGVFTTVNVSVGGSYRYVRYTGGTGWVNIAEMEVDGVYTQPAAVKLSGTAIGTQTSWLNNGDTIAQVFDGNFNSYFDAPNSNLTNWVGLDLGSARSITQIQYAPRAGYEWRMVGGQFQVSNTADFSSGVVTIYTITTAPVAGSFTKVAVSVPGSYRYIRYTGGTGWVNIAEMEVDGN